MYEENQKMWPKKVFIFVYIFNLKIKDTTKNQVCEVVCFWDIIYFYFLLWVSYCFP